MTFEVAFDRVLGHEGVLSLDPQDRGNWTRGILGQGELRGTKYGISAARYPAEDIANLTVERAQSLYRLDFWSEIHADRLPDAVAFQVFDFAVNSGPGTAIRYLQRAVGVADDGIWGPISQAAAAAMSESDILLRLTGERLDFLTRLSAWATQGKGWARRIARNLQYAAEDTA